MQIEVGKKYVVRDPQRTDVLYVEVLRVIVGRFYCMECSVVYRDPLPSIEMHYTRAGVLCASSEFQTDMDLVAEYVGDGTESGTTYISNPLVAKGEQFVLPPTDSIMEQGIKALKDLYRQQRNLTDKIVWAGGEQVEQPEGHPLYPVQGEPGDPAPVRLSGYWTKWED